MPITNTLNGDLIEFAKEGKFCGIVHGCNCHCVMGAGIAPLIAEAFTGVRDADNRTMSGDKDKLGKLSLAYDSEYSLWVVNAYTQYGTGGRDVGEPDIDYWAIGEVFRYLNENFPTKTKPIGIPMIGAGLAGGHWEAIKTIINLVTPDIDITLVKYVPQGAENEE